MPHIALRAPMIALLSGTALALSGCVAAPATAPQGASAAEPAKPAETLNTLFAKYDAAMLSLSPETKAYRGVRDADYGRWDDDSDAAAVTRYKLQQETAAAMRASFDPAKLTTDEALSFTLFDAEAKRAESLFPYRDHGYIFDQMNGAQSQLPAFLINIQRVANAGEAEAYITRLAGLGDKIDALTAQARDHAATGIMPPKWVYPYLLSDIENLLHAGQGDGLIGNAVLDDFRAKVAKLDLTDAEKSALAARAVAAWHGASAPAYARLADELRRQMAYAPTADGVWRLPDGAGYYTALLASYTSTDMTAAQIHDLGLREVARIHKAMDVIQAQVGFKGDQKAFFAHLRDSPEFYHETREAYLGEATTRINAMQAALPRFFNTIPAAPLTVKAVEAFREKSAGKAFYQSPAPDGSRPGTYYVNLYNLRDMSVTELEALAYHEGIPGHHLQRAIQTELKNVPAFRQYGGFTAYTEGWGLYAEELGKDMGFYADPYSDFGRLGMELWRACRLVVDTGIHDKRWSREQAIQYLRDNTPNPEGDIVKAIERYIVYPGQATAYTIGKIKIVELRTRAKAKLGDRFDIREFHDVVLTGGPMPLSVLESRVETWIAGKSAQ
ncbi:MAG: hypothetical protein RLZZ58_25 [Pseudomonadota bacterium]